MNSTQKVIEIFLQHAQLPEFFVSLFIKGLHRKRQRQKLRMKPLLRYLHSKSGREKIPMRNATKLSLLVALIQLRFEWKLHKPMIFRSSNRKFNKSKVSKKDPPMKNVLSHSCFDAWNGEELVDMSHYPNWSLLEEDHDSSWEKRCSIDVFKTPSTVCFSSFCLTLL